MNYLYVGYTEDKKIVNGTIAAASEEAASEVLARLGHKVLSLKPVQPFAPSWEKLFPSFFKVKPDEIAIFFRQLALLANAGTAITTSLELLQAQISNKTFKRTLNEVISDIRAGNRLSDAMSKHPKCFPALYCRSVSVGEQTGELGIIFSQIADYMEKESDFKKGLKSALTYPIIVSVLAIGVVILLVNFVLPTFAGLYSTLGAELPLITRMLLSTADVFQSYGLYMLAVSAIIFITIALYVKSPSGRYKWDRLAFSLPLAGVINRLRELAYCCRIFAMLFRSGVPLTDIMDIAIEGSTNTVITEALVNVKHAMIKGEGLSQPMSNNPIFLPMMVEMVRVGEETGELDATLSIVAQTYYAEAESKTRSLLGLIQPALTIAIGAVVALIVLSMISAMYSIYGQLRLG